MIFYLNNRYFIRITRTIRIQTRTEWQANFFGYFSVPNFLLSKLNGTQNYPNKTELKICLVNVRTEPTKCPGLQIVPSTNLRERDRDLRGKFQSSPIVSASGFTRSVPWNRVTIPSYFLLLFSFVDDGFRDYYRLTDKFDCIWKRS